VSRVNFVAGFSLQWFSDLHCCRLCCRSKTSSSQVKS